MTTITLPKTKYEVLEKKADLYEQIFKKSPDVLFEVEDYTPQRVREFLKEDKISEKTRVKISKILKSI